jgi:histidinol phosphatase-like enzyme
VLVALVVDLVRKLAQVLYSLLIRSNQSLCARSMCFPKAKTHYDYKSRYRQDRGNRIPINAHRSLLGRFT